VFHTEVVEQIKTYIMFNNFFFNCFIYKIMWKNALQLDRLQVT